MASLSLGHNASAAVAASGPAAATAAIIAKGNQGPLSTDASAAGQLNAVPLTVARPVMFPQHNLLVVWGRQAALLLPLMLGLLEETERLRVPLLHGVLDSDVAPLRHAVVTLSDPGIHLYSATLYAYADMSGLT